MRIPRRAPPTKTRTAVNCRSSRPSWTAPPACPWCAVFEAELDRASGLSVVRMTDVQQDQGDFNLRYEPGHPSANAEGYVKYPNVQTLVELMDMREAQRSYEANLNMIESSRRMMERALDMLRR